jgi:hypothetical protein
MDDHHKVFSIFRVDARAEVESPATDSISLPVSLAKEGGEAPVSAFCRALLRYVSNRFTAPNPSDTHE